MLLYFDTSAIVKLMRDEVETAALHRFMKSEPNIYFTCDLSRTEIGRVAIRQQLDPAIVAETVGVFDILTLDTETYNQAGSLPHPFLGLRVKMCVWLGVSRGLDLAFLNAD